MDFRRFVSSHQVESIGTAIDISTILVVLEALAHVCSMSRRLLMGQEGRLLLK